MTNQENSLQTFNSSEELKINDNLEQNNIKEQVNKGFWVNPLKIFFNNNDNVRNINFKNDTDFQELKQNILENGVLTSLYGYRNKDIENTGNYDYVLTHGYRRLNAVLEIIQEQTKIDPTFTIRVPFMIKDKKTDMQQLLEHITLNTGKPLSNLELANIIIKLENFGLTKNEISKKTGFSTARISQILSFDKLINSDTDLKDIVNKKVVSDTTLHETIKKIDDIEQTKKVINNALDNAKKENKDKITKKDITKSIEQLKPKIKEELKPVDKIEVKQEVKESNTLSNTYNSFDDLEQEINKELEQENIKEIEYKKCNECKNILSDNENLICNECISKDYLEQNKHHIDTDLKQDKLNNIVNLPVAKEVKEVKKEVETIDQDNDLDKIINDYLSIMRENNKNFIDKLNKNFSKKLNVKDLNEELTDVLLCFIEIES